MTEKIPRAEVIRANQESKVALLEALRKEGLTEDLREKVRLWIVARAEEADRDPDWKRARIHIEFERAELCLAVGDKDEAIQVLWDALERADNEGFVEIGNDARVFLQNLI